MTTEYSIQKMVSDGTLSTIALGIQYLQRNDIYMRIAGEETPQSGAPSGYTWSFVDNTTIKILPVVPNGVEVVVYRRTNADSMYNVYSQNAQFDEATIDENNTQLLFLSQEYLEQGSGIEAVEYLRSEGNVHYYRLQLYGGRYTDEFTIITQLPLGYERGAGDFVTGFTVMPGMRNVAWLNPAPSGDNNLYSWSGEVPPSGKIVPPNSTPETTGGFVNAWVPRTDETLRGELAALGGAGLVGFSGGDPDLFAARTVADAMKGSMRFDDFKGATDDEKWASMVSYASLSTVRSLGIVFASRTHTFNSSPGVIIKPFDFVGGGRRSTILKFVNCNGINANLSAYGSRYIQSRIANLSVVTTSEKTHTGIYFKGVQSFAPHDPALVLEHVSIFGVRDIDNTAAANTEWLKALHLDDVDEVTINDVYICGSGANANYATRTLSWGIFANKVTSLIVNITDILLVGIGIEMNGQSEGLIGDGLTIVAVDYGVLFRNMIAPCNNHCITNTHIAAYTMGIELRKDAGSPDSHASSVYLSNLFLLEREGNANKPFYTAIEAYVNRSSFDNITIQSNSATSPNRRGIILSNQDNMLSNIFGLNAGALLRIDGVSDGYVYYNNIRCRGDLQSLLVGDVQYAIGANLGLSATPDQYEVRANTFKTVDTSGRSQYESFGGRHMFGGGRHNTNTYLDFRTTSGVNTTYDGRLLFTGGTSGVDGQADAFLYAKATRFSGNVTPSTTNTNTVGTAGFTWSGGFTQTAFTVTSDERYKSTPEEITDAMLDAAAEVDWCMFQYLDRVEEKGADGARWHFGAIAQRFVEAFERHWLDPFRFAFICYDKWGDSPELIGEDGEVVSPAVEAGSRYGIRYDQAIILKQKQIERDHKRQLDNLLSRIEALESA